MKKKKQKQKKPPLQMSKLIILTSSYELWNLAGILLTLLTASMTVDLPTLNTGIEYEFPWAKRYRQKARTFCGGKQSLNFEFCLASLRPNI